MSLKSILLALPLSALLESCATTSPDAESRPLFKTSNPVEVVGSVTAFHDVGAHIDFVDGSSAEYHSIELVITHPDRLARTKLMLQYQGKPVVNGMLIELGDTLRFTAPSTQENGCCEPYLSHIKDIEFIDHAEKQGGG